MARGAKLGCARVEASCHADAELGRGTVDSELGGVAGSAGKRRSAGCARVVAGHAAGREAIIVEFNSARAGRGCGPGCSACAGEAVSVRGRAGQALVVAGAANVVGAVLEESRHALADIGAQSPPLSRVAVRAVGARDGAGPASEVTVQASLGIGLLEVTNIACAGLGCRVVGSKGACRAGFAIVSGAPARSRACVRTAGGQAGWVGLRVGGVDVA